MGLVLVADDDPDIRALVAFKLEQAGHQVIDVPDGVAAVRAARNHQLDLAIVDVTMPGMSGTEVCAALRSDATTTHVPIILLTARAHADDRSDGIAAGADAYMTKPFSPRELLQRVDAVLADAAGAR